MNTTNSFAEALNNENAQTSYSITENGAVGFSRTKSKLLNFFFHIGSMRNWDIEKIQIDFAEAYAEDPVNAIVCIFFARDCRGGMGEKRTFNACFDWLVKTNPEIAFKVLKLIPEYGSWKTFIELTESFKKNVHIENEAKHIVKDKVLEDMSNWGEVHKVSLLGKWLPSENTSSKKTRDFAHYWRNALGLTPREYRKMLSKFRSCLNVVEVDMSGNTWSNINYNHVPAKASQNYSKAFSRHDGERYESWLESLKNNDGNAKINVNGLSVAELVHKYQTLNNKEDPTIEAAWRELVKKGQMDDTVPDMLPIVDGSGSMYFYLSNSSNIETIDVAMGLGLYLANINKSSWKGMLIEYGSNPQFFRVPTEASLFDQLKIAFKHNDCGSTNIEAVYDLILGTAIKNHMAQNSIPNLICFSDMEFNCALSEGINTETLFQNIQRKYTTAGYKLPKMFFWNICSRTNVVPVQENENGVGLISGYSQAIMDMVLSGKIDPLDILLEKLNSERYNPVREAIKK